jgi:hypothetical protein
MIARLLKPLVVAASAAAVLAPVAASAQSYGYPQTYGTQNYGSGAYGQGYDYNRYPQGYDVCARERSGRTGAGGFIGATAGAVIGSQMAARGRRTEGSVLGGLLGAVVGANVGRGSSDRCEQRHGYAYDYGYAPAPYDQGQGYGDYGEPYPYGGQADGYGYDDRRRDSDGCELAESRIRLPDGREDTRYVRACPDEYGRYRVVD